MREGFLFTWSQGKCKGEWRANVFRQQGGLNNCGRKFKFISIQQLEWGTGGKNIEQK